MTAEPTAAGVVNLSDSLTRITSQPITFQLTLGQQLTLPNGETIRQAFRSMSERQVEIFSRTVRNGIIEGESIEAITRSPWAAPKEIRLDLLTRSSLEAAKQRPSQTIRSGRSFAPASIRSPRLLTS